MVAWSAQTGAAAVDDDDTDDDGFLVISEMTFCKITPAK